MVDVASVRSPMRVVCPNARLLAGRLSQTLAPAEAPSPAPLMSAPDGPIPPNRNHKPAMIDHLDHLVLTVADIDTTCDFYRRVLGMQVETFGAGRTALRFGLQKINLHAAGREFEPITRRKEKIPVRSARRWNRTHDAWN